ncbi:MAG: O-antigen ligase family protein [Solirubrobacterales bacterium]|nr:O-antigen ligase family protein [Solirubrobacterales bacterium]
MAGGLAAVVPVVVTVKALGPKALRWWVVAGVIAYPFLRYPSRHSQLTFDRVWILGLGGAMCASAAPAIRRSPASRRVAVWIIALAAVLLLRGLTTPVSRNYAIGIALDAGVLPAILFFAARRTVVDQKSWERLLSSLALAGAMLGLVAVAERLLHFQLATLSGGSATPAADVGARVSGPYSTDDALAVSLLMCLAATILWIQLEARVRWRIGALVVMLELAGITFTFFRGAWIGVLVVIIVGVGLRPRRYARLLGTIAMVGVVAGVLLLRAADSSGLSERINNTQNISGRAATYQQAIELFRLHPVFGVGLGQYSVASLQQLPPSSVQGVSAVAFPHDSYLEAMTEGGLLVAIPLFGLTLAAAMMIREYRLRGRARREDVLTGAMITGAALAYFLMSLEEAVITSSTASNAFFWILLGAVAARSDALAADPPPTQAAVAVPAGTAA